MLKSFAATLFALASAAAFGQGYPVRVVTLPASSIQVNTSLGALASLYSDAALTVPVSQPLTANSSGQASFYIAPATYTATTTNTSGVQSFTFAVGSTGTAGPVGPQGPAGTNGSNGSNGTNGTNGTNGAPGAAATVTVGTTTTGAAGTSASVTNSGTSSAAVFNFTIPQGAAGSGGGSGTVVGGDGITATTAGSTTTLISKPLVNGLLGNNYFANVAANTTATGGGFTNARRSSLVDAVLGRNMGNAYGITVDPWHISQGDAVEFASATAGISELTTHIFDCFQGSGDCSMERFFWNPRLGGAVDSSAESKTGLYLFTTPVLTYKGTVNSGSGGTGATELRTTQTSGCNVQGSNNNLCLGSGGVVIRTNNVVYTGHVTALTTPNTTTYGVMTTDFSVTPSTAYGTIPAGLPDTTNYATGDTLTGVAVTITSGTPAASGYACVSAGWGSYAESYSYTSYSSGTLTLLHHRFAHPIYPPGGGTAAPVNIFFGARCRSISPEAEVSRQGGRSTYDMIGAIDATHIAYVAYGFGQRQSAMQTGGNGYMFAPGTTSHAVVNIYQQAYILSVGDPVILAANAALSSGTTPTNPLSGSSGNSGYMLLTENDIPWAAGDTVETPYYPANQYTMFKLGCNSNLPSSGRAAVCNYIQVDGLINYVNEIGVNNLASAVDGNYTQPVSALNYVYSPSYGLAGGVYNDYALLDSTPQNNLFHLRNCKPGDYTSTCTGSGQLPIFTIEKGGSGGQQWIYDFPTGNFYYNLTHMIFNGTALFNNPVTFTSTFIAPFGTPASSTAACTQGQVENDANYSYVCTATNTWKRAALNAF